MATTASISTFAPRGNAATPIATRAGGSDSKNDSYTSLIAPNEPISVVYTVSRTASPRLRSEEHTSELQSHSDLVCRLLLEKKKTTDKQDTYKQHNIANDA